MFYFRKNELCDDPETTSSSATPSATSDSDATPPASISNASSSNLKKRKLNNDRLSERGMKLKEEIFEKKMKTKIVNEKEKRKRRK